MMAATLAKGETVLRNAAREPEVVDLAELLIKMGAQDRGRGDLDHPDSRSGAAARREHTIIPDRIEAGTFLIAGAITGGDLTVTGCEPEHVAALVSKLQQAGVDVTQPDATVAAGAGPAAAPVSRYDHRGVSRASPPICRRSTWR